MCYVLCFRTFKIKRTLLINVHTIAVAYGGIARVNMTCEKCKRPTWRAYLWYSAKPSFLVNCSGICLAKDSDIYFAWSTWKRHNKITPPCHIPTLGAPHRLRPLLVGCEGLNYFTTSWFLYKKVFNSYLVDFKACFRASDTAIVHYLRPDR